MRVLVVNTIDPFVRGGAEALADSLVDNLREFGHEAELMRIPFEYRQWTAIPSQMAAARGFRIENADKVIALKFPAYLVRHSSKVVWLIHQFRQAYDLFEAGLSNIPLSAEGDELLRVITAADVEALGESHSIFASSTVTAKRLARYNDLAAPVLQIPSYDPELFVGGNYGNYIFAGGRVNSTKRQALLIEALAKASPAVRLVIAGPPDSSSERTDLEALAARLGVTDRLTLDLRFLDRADVADLVNGAAACAYIPLDEDTLGYVTMEAAQARKPIITCTDSGGVLGLVKNGVTGWVAEPTAFALADAMNNAIANRRRVAKLGNAAHDLHLSLGVSWERTIERLTA